METSVWESDVLREGLVVEMSVHLGGIHFLGTLGL
uniref:Uncharacterized protein n=1 Tax=Rhizophora mucronata TaxID=61149 RepID=A0A2P2IRI2_RHIMU